MNNLYASESVLPLTSTNLLVLTVPVRAGYSLTGVKTWANCDVEWDMYINGKHVTGGLTSGSAANFETITYNTAAAVASGASSTHTFSPGATVNFDGFDASASGEMKLTLQIGTTGAETTRGIWFTSASNKVESFRMPYPISVTNTMSIKIIRTNFDKQAMDVYSTILTH